MSPSCRHVSAVFRSSHATERRVPVLYNPRGRRLTAVWPPFGLPHVFRLPVHENARKVTMSSFEIDGIRGALISLPFRLLFRYSNKREHRSWKLYCFDDETAPYFFGACEEALCLLGQHDSRRYQRVLQFVRNIAVLPVPETFFQPDTLSCIMADSEPTTRDAVLGALVHEATHGYLTSKGLKYHCDPIRHERLCLTEEYRSAKRLFVALNRDVTYGQADEWQRGWREYIEHALKSRWWEHNTRNRRWRDHLSASFRVVARQLRAAFQTRRNCQPPHGKTIDSPERHRGKT